MAHAGSNEQVYTPEVPNIESEAPTTNSHPAHHKTPNTGNGETGRATGSKAETGGAGSEEVESESGSKGHKKSGEGSEQGGGNPPTTGGGGGNKPGGGGPEPETGIGNGKEVEAAPKTGTGVQASESTGGSSPVVPILIAVVVLAAISIGVVLYRQRKSGQDGSDGRVSSPNAS